MKKTISPCRGCGDRSAVCHAECVAYDSYKSNLAAEKAAAACSAEAEWEGYRRIVAKRFAQIRQKSKGGVK